MSRATCLKLMTTLILTGILTTASTLPAEDKPLIEESVTELTYVHTADSSNVRIIFIRDGKFIASRWMADDMLLIAGGGQFTLMWSDYCWAERVVHAKSVSHVTLTEDLFRDNGGPWWGQARICVDLKAP